MLNAIKRVLMKTYLVIEGWFDVIFGQRFNPFYYLGALTWLCYWVVAISGIYLYFAFDTGVAEVHQSIEKITHVQWYAGGIMRSLHRYGSDAMVVTTALHLLREFAMDRYHGVRWFAWFTGVPLIWLLITSGVTGYWLVWDELAQYLAIGSFEWLDAISIFSKPIADNFLTTGSLGDRFFTLLIFMHIFAPLFLLFGMWIHLLRLARAETNPPRPVALGALGLLLALALVYPATSHGPADLAKVPLSINLDWFYLAGYPIYDQIGGLALWGVAIGASLLLSLIPFIIPREKYIPAKVDLPNCNGCARCFEDCPFGAVTMQPRTDGLRYEREAVVKESFCTGCGICVGSCPASTPFRSTPELVTGIDLPDNPLTLLRDRMKAEIARLDGEIKVLVFGCAFGVGLHRFESNELGTVTFSCIGQLPPAFIDYALTRGDVDAVLLTACRAGDCYHRLGVIWTEHRLTGYRDPYLRPRIPRGRIYTAWAASTEGGRLGDEVAKFMDEVRAMKRAGTLPTDNEAPAGDAVSAAE